MRKIIFIDEISRIKNALDSTRKKYSKILESNIPVIQISYKGKLNPQDFIGLPIIGGKDK
jgi:hypothetical protein